MSVGSAYGTRANWFAFATGHLFTEAQLLEEKQIASNEGRRQGIAQGRRIGYQEGFEEGNLQGREEGFTEGCQQVFDLLGTDRVMDFWDFYRGARFAYYYTDEIC